MRRILRPVIFAAASAIAVGVAPTTASAATVVGQSFAPANGCAFATYLQTAVASGNSYTVPSPGVITSWTFQDASPIASDLRLKVGRLSGGSAVIVGESAAPTVRTVNQLNGPYPTRIPVLAGDIIGIYTSGVGNCSTFTGSASDTYLFVPGDQPLNTPYSGTADVNHKFPVTASVEPDADNDGYGDETQDQCPSDPSHHGPCPTKSTPTGKRAAALAKCKNKHSARKRRKCRKKANLLPV
jgi:hypothetical protein